MKKTTGRSRAASLNSYLDKTKGSNKKKTYKNPLEPIKELEPKFKTKVSILTPNSSIIEEDLRNNRSSTSKFSADKIKKISLPNKKTFINTLIETKPLYVRQTQYRRKTIF